MKSAMRATSSILACGLACGLVGGAVPELAANGRPPASISLHRETAQPDTLAFGVTFGLLLSFDGGDTWRWACEQAIGFGGIFDPDYEVGSDGSLFAATLTGLRRTTDGCTWSTVPLGAAFASTIAVTGSTILAAAAEFTDSRIYRSTNNGTSFSLLSTACSTAVAPESCGTGEWWKSIEISKADADRVYLSGFVFIPNPACQSGCDCANGECPTTVKRSILFRSNDGGSSWTELSTASFTLSAQSDVIIAAASPTNVGELYVRVTQTVINEPSDIIYKSTNGGDSFTVFLDLSGPSLRREAPAVLVRADGDVWVGGADGLYIGQNGNPPGAATSSYHVVCLAENGDGKVLGCSDNFGDEMAALASTTDGVTWTKVMRFNEISGPFECEPGSEQRDICADLQWCGLAAQFGIATPGCAADAGTDGPLVEPEPKKCGCAAQDAASATMLGALVLLVGGVLARRRRAS
ncbi:MAG: hypothetical protein IPL79_10565 [Myxococcales bacterium]|nr:hypothetical protein [Myxococcales bacterium]